jgi:hypothetical protein
MTGPATLKQGTEPRTDPLWQSTDPNAGPGTLEFAIETSPFSAFPDYIGMVAADGGFFTFGEARWFAPSGLFGLRQPMVGGVFPLGRSSPVRHIVPYVGAPAVSYARCTTPLA